MESDAWHDAIRIVKRFWRNEKVDVGVLPIAAVAVKAIGETRPLDDLRRYSLGSKPLDDALGMMVEQHRLPDRNGKLTVVGIQDPRSLAEKRTSCDVRSDKITGND
jgi:hypothetical protein